MTLLVENQRLVWAAEPKNYTGAAFAGKWVSMKLFRHIAMMILTGAWAGGTAAVTVEQATNVAGSGNTAVSFSWMWKISSAGVITKTAVTSDTFNVDTANTLYVVEFDADVLLKNSQTKPAITLKVASPGANADYYGVLYAMGNAAYRSANLPSPLVD